MSWNELCVFRVIVIGGATATVMVAVVFAKPFYYAMADLKAPVTAHESQPVTDQERATETAPTQWKPGQSGNPAGKPPGTGTGFSQGFIRDFALVWAEEGLEAVRKVAKKES